jgi:serine/threonine protein kinase
VRTFDLVRSEDALFIVMEYVRGADLRTISWRARRRRRALSPAAVVHVAIEILNGLGYAHTRRSARGEPLGIIHRDVSPSNILCSAQGEVKLSDFGIAKAVTYSSVFYRVRGKVGYMSPEQARNQPLDARSDLFSLAVCIFETLIGERLYTGDLQTPADVIYAQPIPSLREKCPGLPPEVELVMRQALAQDRDQRFQDAAAFAQALRQVARKSGILYTGPELAAELSGLLGDNAERWLGEEDAVSVVTQGMPEPRQLEGKEAASIGIVDEGSPNPRGPDSRTVPIVPAGAAADPASLAAAAAARRPSSPAIPVARPSGALDSTGVVAPLAPPRPRRRPRRLLWASAAALLAGLILVSVLGHPSDDSTLGSALKSLRHKISRWRE